MRTALIMENYLKMGKIEKKRALRGQEN